MKTTTYTILYKSGQKVHVKLNYIKANYDQSTGDITNLEWKPSSAFFFAGIHNIEAIYAGKK